MRINELIVDQLHRAFSSSPWHGPSLLEILEDVSHDVAAAHPMANTHSIWELVLHLASWKDVVRRRLTSTVPIQPNDEENFPAVPEPTSANWTTTLERLQRTQDQLVEAIRSAAPESFEKIVPGKDYNQLVMLLGIPQHDDYHAGQIALLKKAYKSRSVTA